MGVGPFLFLDEGTGRPPNPSFYRGREVAVELRIAFGFVGDVQLEIIQQVNDAPSPYRDFLGKGREGLQHLGYWVDDHARACAQVEQAGYSKEFEIPVPGQHESIIYYRAPDLIGPSVEIVPPRWRRARQAVFDRLGAWQGGDPIIRYPTYGDFLADAQVEFD